MTCKKLIYSFVSLVPLMLIASAVYAADGRESKQPPLKKHEVGTACIVGLIAARAQYLSNHKTEKAVECLGVIQDFLGSGANPNLAYKQDEDTIFPLHCALSHDDAPVVDALLLAKANPSLRDNEWCTPLYVASMRKNPYTMQRLIEAKAAINARNPQGDTALIYYLANYVAPNAVEKNLAPLKILLNNGASPNISSYDQVRAPLHMALFSEEATKLLLDAKAFPSVKANGATPLHVSAVKGQYANMRLLIEAKAMVNEPSSDGKSSPLHSALMGAYLRGASAGEEVRILLDAQADPNMQDNAGNTPLHWTIKFQDVCSMSLLLSRKADPFIKNNAQETPYGILLNLQKQ